MFKRVVKWLVGVEKNGVEIVQNVQKSTPRLSKVWLSWSQELMDEIMEALKNKSELGINESVTLVEGFIDVPMNKELSSSFIIGGPTVPCIMLIGNQSGQIYIFSLKILLPRLQKLKDRRD